MEYIFQAIIIGVVLSLMVGPVFFLLLELSITKGFKQAVALDLGVLLSDVMFIFFSIFFAHQIRGVFSDDGQQILGIIGGGMFLVYGTYMIFFKQVKFKKLTPAPKMRGDLSLSDSSIKQSKKDYALLILKGFTLNLLNPGVIIYWLAIVSKGYDLIDGPNENQHIFVFLLIVLTVFFGIDVLKIYLAHKLRSLVNAQLLKQLNLLTGAIFAGTGLFFILRHMMPL